MIQMSNEHMARLLLSILASVTLGCGGSDLAQDEPSIKPHTSMVAPNLPITKVVEVDAGSDSATANTQWAEMCYYQMGDHVFAMHSFPGIDAVDIYTHVKVYEALDIPVEVTSPLVTYGEAWYDCGKAGTTTPMIIFNWIN